MKHSSEQRVRADVTTVGDALADLSTYPVWNALVHACEAAEPVESDEGPAWNTTLRGQVGPFARSKQLRFVRTVDDATPTGRRVRFERRELGEREHANWVMAAAVRTGAIDGEALVEMSLHYDGSLWIPTLGTILESAIERSTAQLERYAQR